MLKYKYLLLLQSLLPTEHLKKPMYLIPFPSHSCTLCFLYFTPTQAMFFTWLLSVLCGGILGLIIYGCNVISKSKVVGIVASGFLVILSAAVSGNEMAQWFSPVSWTTLNKLDVGKLTQYPTFTYVMVVYMTAIIILSVWIIKVIEKKDVGVMIREV